MAEAEVKPALPENVIKVNFYPAWFDAIVDALKTYKREEVIEDIISQGYHPTYAEVLVRRCMAKVLRMGKRPT